MQVYLTKNGAPQGPFSVGQLRQYMETGHCQATDYACHDGTNWVTIADVPGIAKKAQRLTNVDVLEKISRKKLYLIVGIVTGIALSVSCVLYFVFRTDTESGAASASQIATTGNIFTLTPEEIVSIYDGDTFKIDLAGVHPLFGDDVSVRLFGVDTPEMRGSEDRVKLLAEKARKLTEQALMGAEKIELKNPRRGKYFRIIADVYVDGKSLAALLMKAGLGKAYDGEGAKPVW
jgi:endonuclease YncB( thermonuclease family)